MCTPDTPTHTPPHTHTHRHTGYIPHNCIHINFNLRNDFYGDKELISNDP